MSAGSRSDEAMELVFALCHEVRNLLAATRLQLEAGEGDAESARRAGARIAELSERAGALVACVRPLVETPPASQPRSLAPAVLDGVARQLAASSPRVEVEAESDEPLPELAMDPDVLHQALLVCAFGALDSLPAGAPLRVFARKAERGAAFVLEGPMRRRAGSGRLCGPELAEAIALRLLRARGGRLVVREAGGLRRIELEVPAAWSAGRRRGASDAP